MCHRGLICSCCASHLSYVFSLGPSMFLFVVRASFACRWGLIVSLNGPACALSRSQFSAALAVLGLPLWRARLSRVRYFCRPCTPWRSTCHGYQGSWYRVNWAADRQVYMLHVFLESDSGAASWHSGGDTVEYYQRMLMLTTISGRNRCVDVAK